MATVIAVRLHNIARQLWFDPQDTGAEMGDHVVVTTERGIEMGLACSDAFDVEESDLRAPLKPVLRVATDEDLAQAEELGRKGEEALPVFRQLAKSFELDMKPLDVDFLFGGDKAIFYFTAEERVDFRGLVRELANEFHVRIDMRQIGVRDEAQLVGGIAHCGQELCCVRMGGEFKPVSIRMAKEQDLPLNPLKISGFCGRLMCCLRYEFEAYKDFKARAPKKNALIETPLGMAKVIGFGTPRETVDLRLEDGKTFSVPLAEMGYADGTVAGDYEDRAPVSADKNDKDDPDADQEFHGCPAASGKPPCPGRPCSVSRASLDLHGDTQIALALAAYDREHGLVADEDLSADRIDEVRERPKKRRTRGEKEAEDTKPAAEGQKAEPRETRRRRQRRTQTDTEAAEKPAEQEQASRRQRAKAEPEGQRESRRNPRRRHRTAAAKQDAPAAEQPAKEARPAGEGAQKRSGRSRVQRRRSQRAPEAQAPAQQEAAPRPRPGQNSSGLRAQRSQDAQPASAAERTSARPAGRRRRRTSGGPSEGKSNQ